MTVSVFLIETRSVVNNLYRVDTSVTTSSGISTKIFVKRESTYEYDRVASLNDMLTLPETPDPNVGYYRDSAFYRDFADVSAATQFGLGVKDRVDKLMTIYNDAVNDFIGSEGETISS